MRLALSTLRVLTDMVYCDLIQSRRGSHIVLNPIQIFLKMIDLLSLSEELVTPNADKQMISHFRDNL